MIKIIRDLATLRRKSEPVTSVKEAQKLIGRLRIALKETDNGVGLSAIQIGEAKRLGVIRYQDKEVILINPKLIEAEDEFIFVNEGCLSFPNEFHDTKRYHQCIVESDVIDGDELRRETWSFYYSCDQKESGNDGLLAIAVQHELDHFDGKLFIDFNLKREPIERRTDKIGRNDPCPCGSGKKYKKCCL